MENGGMDMSTVDSVHGRIEIARSSLTTTQIVLGFGLLAVVGATLLFFQEPAVHEALHDFRHAAGITCH